MLLIFITCSISFSLSTIDSPLRFFIRFFSSFLQAYIFPVARVWQAHTSPKPPLPRTRYIRKVLEVTACRSSHFHWIHQKYRHQNTLYFTFTFCCCFPHGKPRNAFVCWGYNVWHFLFVGNTTFGIFGRFTLIYMQTLTNYMHGNIVLAFLTLFWHFLELEFLKIS